MDRPIYLVRVDGWPCEGISSRTLQLLCEVMEAGNQDCLLCPLSLEWSLEGMMCKLFRIKLIFIHYSNISMWIQVEFNPDLALRHISHFEKWDRKEEECIPKNLRIWEIYSFLKKWQRNFYLLQDEPIPLIQTEWNAVLSRPHAAIRILEATHFYENGEIWTRWRYQTIDIYDTNNPEIHFEWFLSVKW